MKICKYEITQMIEEDWHPLQQKSEMNQKGDYGNKACC
jgi:hypothetical protein